jgi:hypothetical protein
MLQAINHEIKRDFSSFTENQLLLTQGASGIIAL